jgi:hypothetical protein
VMQFDSYKNRSFRGKYLIHHQGEKNQRANNSVRSNKQLSSFGSPKRRFLKDKRRHIPEDGILHSHRRENPKSYKII